MNLEFNCHGNNKQLEALRAWLDPSVEDIVYGGAKGSGKTYLGASAIFSDALTYPDTMYFIARKKLNDLRKFTIPSIHEVFNNWGLDERYFKYNGTDNFFSLYNGSKVFLLEAKYLPSDPMYYRFGSMQMTRGMIEEAGEFEVEAKNNLFASVGRWKNEQYNLKGKVIQTCNPSKNYLYKDYYKPHKLGELESHKRFIQALPSDNKKLDAGYLEMLRRSLSINERERLLNGNWEYDDDPNALCDYESILSIFNNDHIQPEERHYLTADIARLGSDKAIIAIWKGWTVIEFIIFDVSRTTEIQEAIRALRIKYQIPARYCIADEDGVGGGVVDNTGIKGFMNGSRPIEVNTSGALFTPNYMNLQSQCCYGLAEKINAHEIHIQAEISEKQKAEIIEELEQLKSYKVDSEQKIRILPKEQIKQNIGRSPDWRDTLMMRKFFDLNPFKGSYSVGSV